MGFKSIVRRGYGKSGTATPTTDGLARSNQSKLLAHIVAKRLSEERELLYKIKQAVLVEPSM